MTEQEEGEISSPIDATMVTGRTGFALVILTAINLINYLDRYIVAGVVPAVERDFGIDHTQAGLLGTVFMVVYMVASPIGGYLGDRVQRRYLVAGSVFLWSLATAASGLAQNFEQLLVARAITGIGEAGYGTVAPALLADLFPRSSRTRVLAFFYTAIPVGAALGFIVGGAVTDAHSWQMAFYVGAIPGLALAIWALRLPEIRRGASDGDAIAEKMGVLASLRALSTNGTFWISTAGLTLMTFSIGGLAYWMPTFLEKERGMTATAAGLGLGAVTVGAGFVGTLAGGVLGSRLERRRPDAGLILSGIGLCLAAPLMVIAALSKTPSAMFTALTAAQFLVFLNNGPLNAAIVSSVPAGLRSFAVGINTLVIHLAGDASSPAVIGWIASHSSLQTAIEVNAVPVVAGGLVLLGGTAIMKWRNAVLQRRSAPSG